MAEEQPWYRRGADWRAVGRDVSRRLSEHRRKYGRWAVITLSLGTLMFILALVGAVNWVADRRGLAAEVLAFTFRFVLRPWFYGPLVVVSAGVLIWLYLDGERRIRRLEELGAVRGDIDSTLPPLRSGVGQSIPVGQAQETDTAMPIRPRLGSLAASVQQSEEGDWLLTLERTTEEPAYFRVSVTDPLGAQSRKEFARVGRSIRLQYPTDFALPGSAIPPMPPGSYAVEWDVFRLSDDEAKMQGVGTAGTKFSAQATGYKSSEEHPDLSEKCLALAEEIWRFATDRERNRPRLGTGLGIFMPPVKQSEDLAKYDNSTAMLYRRNFAKRIDEIADATTRIFPNDPPDAKPILFARTGNFEQMEDTANALKRLSERLAAKGSP